MSHTFHSLHFHLVFSVKDRKPLLSSDTMDNLGAYLAGALRKMDMVPTAIGGHLDHVHVLFRAPQTINIPVLVKELKRPSGDMLRARPDITGDFYWQTGYAIFSVSHWDCEKVAGYIRNQETHHARTSWPEELRKLLRRHGVEWSEDYLLG